jgi:hypothetical protein
MKIKAAKAYTVTDGLWSGERSSSELQDCVRVVPEATWRKIIAVVRAAEGMTFGTDWNNGTHAKIYRKSLEDAMRALRDHLKKDSSK